MWSKERCQTCKQEGPGYPSNPHEAEWAVLAQTCIAKWMLAPSFDGNRRFPTPIRENTLRADIEKCLKENWAGLFAYAARLSGDRDAAGDLIQSCALKALASPAPPRETGAIRAWLYAILRNTFIDDRRRAKVRLPEVPVEALGSGGWGYDDRLIAGITVRQAMECLEADHREIVQLIDLAGFRYAEAAAILDLPLGTVTSRLSRARLALLQAIETENVTPIGASRRHAG